MLVLLGMLLAPLPIARADRSARRRSRPTSQRDVDTIAAARRAGLRPPVLAWPHEGGAAIEVEGIGDMVHSTLFQSQASRRS
jgi:hypothetical protein